MVEFMYHNGLRSGFLSAYTKFYAEQNACETTETLMAYTFCWRLVVHFSRYFFSFCCTVSVCRFCLYAAKIPLTCCRLFLSFYIERQHLVSPMVH